MDLSDLKEILRILEEQDITEFELEQDGVKLRVCRSSTAPAAGALHVASVTPAGPTPAQLAAAAQPPAEIEADGTVVRSPIVGTFYRSPDPDSPARSSGGRHRPGRAGALHHRSHEAHERDRVRDAGGSGPRSIPRTGSPSSTASPLFTIRLA